MWELSRCVSFGVMIGFLRLPGCVIFLNFHLLYLQKGGLARSGILPLQTCMLIKLLGKLL